MSAFDPVLLTLPSEQHEVAPPLALEILPHGLTFHRLLVQVDRVTHDILIGPEAPRGHLDKKYNNTIIGRYANRVPVGTHEVERNGFKASLEAQANENPRVSLHGGPSGFDVAHWEQLITRKHKPELFSAKELSHLPPSPSSHAIFRHVSPSGDQGYPGTLTVEVLVALVPKEGALGSVVYVYRAKVDKGVTPINLTQHWGFNLTASIGDLLVKDHSLLIKADRIVERDKDSLHTGNYISVADVPIHKHDGKKIDDGYPAESGGYDDFYVFEPRETAPRRVPLSDLASPDFDLVKDVLEKVSEKVVELASEKSGLSVAFDTNQTGAMFYSNGMANPMTSARKMIHGGSGTVGDGYTPASAAFLEFHEPLTAFLEAVNKDKDDTLLTEEELYHNYVRCDIKYSK